MGHNMMTSVRYWCVGLCAAWLLAHTSAWGQTRGLPASDHVVLHVSGRIQPAPETLKAAKHRAPQLPPGVLGFDLQTLESLPQHAFTTLTPWSHQAIAFSGPLLRDVLAMAGAQGQQLRATAINDYRIQIPVDDTMRFNVIVATRMNGQRMSVRDKGPLFVVYPFDTLPELKQARYYERSIWQLKSLEVE